MRALPWLTLGVLSIVAFGVVGLFAAASIPEREATEEETTDASSPVPVDEPLITFIDPVKGSASAELTIVEYGDHACAFCREAERSIDRVIEEHPNAVRFVWKDLPSPVHTGADVAAEAAHCAKDQGRFWEYHALLFEQGFGFNHTSLALLANDLGLDTDRFGRCLSNREKRHVVERSVSEAKALGIDGTPYFFINGERYDGQIGYAELKAIVSR